MEIVIKIVAQYKLVYKIGCRNWHAIIFRSLSIYQDNFVRQKLDETQV